MRAKVEILALILGFIGLFGTITVTALPMWRVSAFIGANLIVFEELWEGLWMNCFRQIDVKMQCKAYDSLLILPPELQAARALMCVSIVLVIIAMVVTGFGTQHSSCCNDNIRCKNITLALAGAVYLLSCLFTLIPVSWVGHTIIRNFYNPTVEDSQKRELGEALFLGWATSFILLIAGILLLLRYSKRESKEEERHTDAYIMAPTDVNKEESVYLDKKSNSSYKNHEYV